MPRRQYTVEEDQAINAYVLGRGPSSTRESNMESGGVEQGEKKILIVYLNLPPLF